MNPFGRISVCGAIALYNDTAPTMVPCIEPTLVFKQIKMEGFLVHRWLDRYQEGMDQMSTWIKEVSLSFYLYLIGFSVPIVNDPFNQGKIKIKETYTDGFENMPIAFIDMLQGKNTGKAIVRV